METLPFATKPLQSSTWGSSYSEGHNTYKPQINFQPKPQSDGSQHSQQTDSGSSDEPIYPRNHFEYMPAVLLNSLKRDKKPFTYTPGRVDLSEVLNNKLQKRLERKKKHIEEKFVSKPQAEELPAFEPPKQVLVMPTYNSPIDMYSMENALEALEVQAEVTVAEKSLSPQRTQTLPRNYKYEVKDFEPKNVTQSKAFKVLQIITDTEEQQPQDGNTAVHPKTEMSFTGTGQRTIPSKYFHTLQKITGTDKDDNLESQRPKIVGFQSDAGHLQVEDRFTGLPHSKAIPSKYFQNLQRLTGTEETESVPSGKSESRVYENNVNHYETKFSGTGTSKVIPSKYFHNLQRITGTEESEHTEQQARGNKVHFKTAPGQSSYSNTNSENRNAPASFQPMQSKSFAVNTIKASIPVLQRPAAFLSAAKKDSIKKTCSVRFSPSEVPYTHAGSIRAYEGTDF